jgi:hypothetical protein
LFTFPIQRFIIGFMRATVFLILSGFSLSAQDIPFANRTASFTTLEGRAYSDVTLVKGDLDGLIWRDRQGSGGRICYTNLDADFLDRLGIPSERIATARDRAGHKAVADARYRAELAAQARAQRLAKQKAQAERATNATAVAQGGNLETPYDSNASAYPSVYMDYAPVYPYVLGSAASAPSAPSAPSAMSAPSTLSFPSASPAAPGQNSASVPITVPMLPAPSAASAPMSGASPSPARPRFSK